MSNPNPTRLSPAELRRRLLAPPTADAVQPVRPDDDAAPAMPTRMAQRRNDAAAGRFGGSMGTQMAIDLDSLVQEMGEPASPPAKLTPLPDGRLDTTQFRNRDGSGLIAQPGGLASLAPARTVANEAELWAQNAELSRIIEEMRPVLEEASAQEQRYAARLGEKDRQIEELTAKVKQVEEQLAAVPAPKVPKSHDELEEWGDDLEKESAKLNQERRKLDGDRKQLHDDEESLEKQMREMECSMARERAMIARQETELKRLSAEIQHELEMLQRGDGTLREQLAKFQRRHQEVITRATNGPPPMAEVVEPPRPPAAAPPTKKDSGLLRRIFGGGK
jgi:hypothetical protein